MDEETQAVAARLVRRLKEADWTISIAESCTGGLLASTLTDIAGASEWFTHSWVTYSNEAKAQQLHVSENLLEKDGAVSAKVAIEMAKGALKNCDADVALSITGIAGPVSDDTEKPVGLVFVGIATRHWANAGSFQTGGTKRNENKQSFVHFALRYAIECWDKAQERAREAEEEAKADADRQAAKLAQQEVERSKREAAARSASPWQDEAWSGNPSEGQLDGQEVDWANEK